MQSNPSRSNSKTNEKQKRTGNERLLWSASGSRKRKNDTKLWRPRCRRSVSSVCVREKHGRRLECRDLEYQKSQMSHTPTIFFRERSEKGMLLRPFSFSDKCSVQESVYRLKLGEETENEFSSAL